MPKIKIEIKSYLTGLVLFEHEKEGNTIIDTLIEAISRGANLQNADLTGANLRHANMEGVKLRYANLMNADLRSANLKGADLRGVTLKKAYLKGAYMGCINLKDANLKNADLLCAYLNDANLRDADLTDADLRGANLENADLGGANLTRANLDGANLESADLTNADLDTFKKDFFDVLLRAIPEIENLKNALINGKINGSTYAGECACLCGTLEKSNIEEISERIASLRDAERPIEVFFTLLKPGDTPENNYAAKVVMEWIEEFEQFIKPIENNTLEDIVSLNSDREDIKRIMLGIINNPDLKCLLIYRNEDRGNAGMVANAKIPVAELVFMLESAKNDILNV